MAGNHCNYYSFGVLLMAVQRKKRRGTMTIGQLHYVIEIVKAGSISAAANQLFISRTVLSSAVSRLEDELGRKLFVRTSRGIHLTPFGKLFLDHIREP